MTALRYIGAFIIFLFLQVFLFNHLTLLDLATPHVFLVFLLMVPMSLPFAASILLAFFVGLSIDLLSYDIVKGVHAFSCVLMMAARSTWAFLVSNKASYREGEEFDLQGQSNFWFLTYLIPLILVHQTAYHFLEAFDLSLLGLTLLKTLLSTIYSSAWVIILTFLFYRRSRR